MVFVTIKYKEGETCDGDTISTKVRYCKAEMDWRSLDISH